MTHSPFRPTRRAFLAGASAFPLVAILKSPAFAKRLGQAPRDEGWLHAPGKQRHHQDAQVEPERPVVDVVQVVLDAEQDAHAGVEKIDDAGGGAG